MQTIKKRGKQCLLLFLTFAISMGIFFLSYRFDNKYTQQTPQPIGGVLFFTPDKTPLTHLIGGWQYYLDELLTPKDFEKEPPSPDGYTWIGQYSGMEAGRKDVSPHGSITYRLLLSLPEETASYTLELPEIYSAYRLYINDRQVASSGIPEAGQYKARVHSGSITFEASGDTSLLLAVSDWSYLYSGLVYPPAFGTPEQVHALLEQRFAWSLSVPTLALLLAIFQALFFVLLKSRRALYSSMIAAAFAVSVCSTAMHRLIATDITPFYNIELFCRYAVYGTAVLLVNHLYSRKSRGSAAVSAAAILFPFAAFAISFAAPVLSSQGMLFFSQLSDLYKISCALWILCTAFLSGMKESSDRNHLILLAGTCVFASSLAADRLLPGFEPIRFGWFSETAGLIFVLMISFVMFQNSFAVYKERLLLSQEKVQLQGQIQMQKKHYTELVDQMEEIRAMRHDTRHHFTQLTLLLQEGAYQEAEHYLAQVSSEVLKTIPLTFCANYTADVLLRYYYAQAQENGIHVSIQARLPEHIGIPDGDLSVVLGNLLENAVEANLRLPESKRFLALNITLHSSNLYIEACNAFNGELTVKDGIYSSSKEPGRTGIGVSSIRTIAEKYDGEVWVNTEESDTGHLFTIHVLLLSS